MCKRTDGFKAHVERATFQKIITLTIILPVLVAKRQIFDSWMSCASKKQSLSKRQKNPVCVCFFPTQKKSGVCKKINKLNSFKEINIYSIIYVYKNIWTYKNWGPYYIHCATYLDLLKKLSQSYVSFLKTEKTHLIK